MATKRKKSKTKKAVRRGAKRPAKRALKKRAGKHPAKRPAKRGAKRGAKRRKGKGAKRTVGRVPIPAKLPSAVASYLKKTSAKVEPLGHRTVFTAYDAAQTLKLDLKTVGKTLVLSDGTETIVAVIPASHNADLKALGRLVKEHRARHGAGKIGKLAFATERTIKSRLKATPGAVPPFGPMLGLETYVDKLLTKPSTVVVSGGSFEASLSMTPTELLRLSQGIVGSFSKERPK